LAYGSPHSETIPTVADTLGTDYATMVNAVLTEVRTTLDAKVTPAGMSINADLSMRTGATRYGLTDIHRLSLYQQPSLLSAATYPVALYANSSGDLYYNNASSAQVRITNGSALNGTPGSITGSGYGSTGVEVNWDAGASDYHMYSGTGTYADVKLNDVLLNDGDTHFIRHAAPALAGDYTVTWPSAVPGSNNTLLTMATTGTLSNTGTPTVTSLTTTGALSVGTTSTLTGKVTFGVEVAHPSRVRHFAPADFHNISGSAAFNNPSTDPHWTAGVGNSSFLLGLGCEEGETISEIEVYVVAGANAGTRRLDIMRWNTTVGGSVHASVTSTATSGTYKLTLGAADWVVATPDGNGSGVGILTMYVLLIDDDDLRGARVTYHRA
jgi:hypothetical protein